MLLSSLRLACLAAQFAWALRASRAPPRRPPVLLRAAETSLEVAFVVGSGASPYGQTSPRPSPSWEAVGRQLPIRLNHFDARIAGTVLLEDDDAAAWDPRARYDAVVALGCRRSGLAEFARCTGASCLLVDDASSSAVQKSAYCGAYDGASLLAQVVAAVPWTRAASGKRMTEQARKLLARHSTEDACFAVLLALHQFVAPIPVASSDINPSWEKGLVRNANEFREMARCCGKEIFAALSDPQTKKAIDLLNAVDLRDQVGSYRVIVSNETPQLEAFSLCILQQNNCFNCDAPLLDRPVVEPLRQWRGRPLDAQADRQILYGHLDHPDAALSSSERQPWSWRIACGANPAYDAFPCQHQIFYPAGKGTALWYDPVFLVETLDGPRVWTKRHYRCVPRGESPGRWTLTTLDNGILSKEHWTTVAAADDLAWAVLHYSGHARAAGQSYQGALLCTADGKWPRACALGTPGFDAIERAFHACGLELWELYGHGPPDPRTDRSFMWNADFSSFLDANPPPLDPIGDITITKWREQERRAAAKAAASSSSTDVVRHVSF